MKTVNIMESTSYFQLPENLLTKPPKRGKDLIRDDAKDHGLVNSLLLNGGNLGGLSQPMNDRKYLTGMKLEMLGDRQGQYLRNGSQTMSVIPALINKINEIDTRIADHKMQQERQGFPETIPKDLSSEMSKLLGLLDVRLLELRDIDKRLKIFDDQKQAADDSMVLAYGLRMMGKLRGGTLAEIDGQTVGRTADGVLIINDLRSQYNGMSVLDFRQMAAKWQDERRQADKEKLLELQEEYKKKGWLAPSQLPVTGHKKVARATLPGWPAGAVNYLAVDDIADAKK